MESRAKAKQTNCVGTGLAGWDLVAGWEALETGISTRKKYNSSTIEVHLQYN